MKTASMRTTSATFDLSKAMTDMISSRMGTGTPHVIADGRVCFRHETEKQRMFARISERVLDIENRDFEEHLDLLTSICATSAESTDVLSFYRNNKQYFKSNIGLDDGDEI